MVGIDKGDNHIECFFTRTPANIVKVRLDEADLRIHAILSRDIAGKVDMVAVDSHDM